MVIIDFYRDVATLELIARYTSLVHLIYIIIFTIASMLLQFVPTPILELALAIVATHLVLHIQFFMNRCYYFKTFQSALLLREWDFPSEDEFTVAYLVTGIVLSFRTDPA